MCDWFDNFSTEDFAFWGGFIETQIEGEKDEVQEDEPLSYKDSLKTGDDVFDKVSNKDTEPEGI